MHLAVLEHKNIQLRLSPTFKKQQEERDKERLEEIRELNRATLKATGEQMSEEEINELRPSRYLDRREFKDDD